VPSNAPFRAPSPPQIPGNLEALDVTADESLDDALWSEVLISAAQLGSVRAGGVAIASSRLSKVNVSDGELARFSATDVDFNECNFSNAAMPKSTFRRVVFSDCKLTGVRVLSGILTDVELNACRLDYAGIHDVKFKQVTMRNCQLRESEFSGCSFESVRFIGCDFTRATFARASFAGSEFRHCTLAELRGLSELRGAAMDFTDILAHADLFALELGIGIVA
jgi:uncharacterized protein YjbI with pentapeptide repeats